MGKRILVVEDDHAIRSLLHMLLEDELFDVRAVATAAEALAECAEQKFDLVLLDIRLPDSSGFEVCRQLRRVSDVPIIMVTAQHDSHDVVVGLELGADDYVTKPFNDRELLARIRVQLRRTTAQPLTDRISIGGVEISPSEGVARRDGQEIPLTRTEFQLLCHLARHPNRVWSREQLLVEIWGYDYAGDGRLVDTHVARLRSKIETDPASPEIIHTVRGFGYKLTQAEQ